MPNRLSPAARAQVQPIAALLAFGSLCLIVYGSLFPFDFSHDAGGLLQTALGLHFRRTTRGDIVANLLLYLPLGLGLVPLLRERYGRVAGLTIAVATGLWLSFVIEVLQAYAPSRVSSLTDLLLNGVSTLAGGVAALLLHRFAGALRLTGTPGRTADPSALVAVLFWFCFRLAPFVPTVDWQKYKNALKPVLLNPEARPLQVLTYLVGWLVADHALRRCFKGANPWLVLALAAAAVIAGRLVIVDKALSLAELIALPLCIPLAAALARVDDRRRATTLAVATMAVVVLQGLEPFSWSATSTAFSWLPFRNSINGNLELGYTVLFEKAFWYTALIWLGTRAGWSFRAATGTAVLLLTLIEVTQQWLPGRSAEITDPLLALGFAVLLRVVARSTVAALAAVDYGREAVEPSSSSS
ncbi:MAG TPA: VanZ family protein [Gammaproteobacteria bacterium]|nr:VanZ family protein [Gammaproteobacteria bacterium]